MQNIKLPKIIGIETKILLAIVILFLSLGLSAIVLLAYFGVPVGDDYLAIKTFSDPQNWLGEAWYSFTHTGRYAQSITSSISYGLLGSSIAVILPAFTLIWLYVLIYHYIKLIFAKLKITIELYSIHLFSVGILILLIFTGSPAVPQNIDFMYQGFFFSSAIVTYTLSILAVLSLLYLFITKQKFISKNPMLIQIILYISLFYVSLHNEVLPMTLFALSVFAIIFSALRSDNNIITTFKNYRMHLVGVSATSLLALVVMFFSPSRIARSSAIAESASSSPGITDIIFATFEKLPFAMSIYIDKIDAILIFLFSVSTIIVLSKIRNIKYSAVLKWGAIIFFIGILSTLISLGLQVIGYGVHTNIYGRAMVLSHSVFIIGLLSLSIGSIGVLNQRIKLNDLSKTFLLLICVIVGGLTLNRYIITITDAVNSVQSYNAIWTEQDKKLKEHSKENMSEIIYLDENAAGIGDGFSLSCTGPFSESTNWLNQGMASYYGIDKICSITDIKELE